METETYTARTVCPTCRVSSLGGSCDCEPPATDTGTTDTLGVSIRVGDTVRVTSYGYAVQLIDTGRTFVVTGTTRAGNLTHDADVANGRAVRPGCVAVARRDGRPGHEGNA